MSVTPRVERLPLSMGPLASAVRDGTLPAGASADVPQTRRRGASTLDCVASR